MRAALAPYDIRRILRGSRDAAPADDFRLIDSWAEYDESRNGSENERELQYLCYEIEVIDPENGKRQRAFKAIKFARVIRLPKEAKQSTSMMDMHSEILAACYEQGYNLVTVIANIIEPVPLGLLYLYGVQGVAATAEEAKDACGKAFTGLISMLQGTYRVLHLRAVIAQESEWLREKIYSMDYLTMITGIPQASKSGETGGAKGIGGTNVNPDAHGTLEQMIIGMVDHEYVIQILSTPVYASTLKAWSVRTQQDMTDWNSQLQGTKSISFNLSIPMMYMANASQSQGWSQAYTDAESVSYNTGESFSQGVSESIGHSISNSIGESFGSSYGTSVSDSTSYSQSVSNGTSVGTSSSISEGISSSFGRSMSEGFSQTESTGTSESAGTSVGTGTSQGISQTLGVSSGESLGFNQGNSYTVGQGAATGLNQSSGWSEGLGTSHSQSLGTNMGGSHTQNIGQSQGANQSQSLGQNVGGGYSFNQGQNAGASQGFASGANQGINQGMNSGSNMGGSYSYGENQGTQSGGSMSNSLGSSWSQSGSAGGSESRTFTDGASGNQSYTNSLTNTEGLTTTNSSSQGTTNNFGYTETAGQGNNAGVSFGANIGGNWSESTTDTSNAGSTNTGNSSSLAQSDSLSEGQSWGNSDGWSSSESAGNSSSWSAGWSDGGSSTNTAGSSWGNSNGSSENWGNSWGASQGESYGMSQGTSQTDSYGNSWGASQGESWSDNWSNSRSDSWGTSIGASQGESWGENWSNSMGESWGLSQNTGVSGSLGISQSDNMSANWGVSEGQSTGFNIGNSVSDGWNQGTSTSAGMSRTLGTSTGQSLGTSVSSGVTDTQGTSSSRSAGNTFSQNVSFSNGVSQGRSVGQTETSSVSQSYSNGTSQSATNGTSVSTGKTAGRGTSESVSQSMGTSGTISTGSSGTMGLGPSIGYNKSYQWLDQTVKDILEILEFQNERIKKALRGIGAFYTYVYIATDTMDALSAAMGLARTTWYNNLAMAQPIQALALTEEEQRHLLYHFSAFSADVTRETVGGVSQYRYATVLLSCEYVAYTHLPRISEGGIFAEAEDVPKFAVPSMLRGEIYMGSVLSAERHSFKNGYQTPYDYRISETELMHGFITGASRSGKTVAAMRFVAELSKVRRSRTGKRLRIVCMDPKRDWRTLARFVEPERFRFYSMVNPNFHPINLNPCKIPRGVVPQIWIDALIEIYCRAYGLLERGKQLMADTFYYLYEQAGVFEAQDHPGWEEAVPELSRQVTFTAAYERMLYNKRLLEDPSNPKGKAGNDTRDAYSRLLERLSAFERPFSIERRIFGSADGIGVDELIGGDDVTVIESKGLESTFKNFIFGVITSGFFRFAIAHEDGYLAPDQFETVLVIEEANEVLTGNDSAGSGGGQQFGLTGQSEFEQILDQAAGYGLFIFAITQKIADMPKSIIANSGLVFAGKVKSEDDINVIVKTIGRDPRYDNRDVSKWFPRSPTGWFVCQSSRTNTFTDAEPVLCKIAMLNMSPPSNAEIEELLLRKETAVMLREIEQGSAVHV